MYQCKFPDEVLIGTDPAEYASIFLFNILIECFMTMLLMITACISFLFFIFLQTVGWISPTGVKSTILSDQILLGPALLLFTNDEDGKGYENNFYMVEYHCAVFITWYTAVTAMVHVVIVKILIGISCSATHFWNNLMNLKHLFFCALHLNCKSVKNINMNKVFFSLFLLLLYPLSITLAAQGSCYAVLQMPRS